MSETPRLLLRQLETAWALASYHLHGLTTEERLWRPAAASPHVGQDNDGVWRAAVEGLSDTSLLATEHTRWPFTGRPFADVVAWASIELTKNASEVGSARFLYAVRGR